jgi:hypothetical protein
MLVRDGADLRKHILASGRYRSLAAFGRRIGYSRRYLSAVCRGRETQVSERFVTAVCDALDLQRHVLFSMPKPVTRTGGHVPSNGQPRRPQAPQERSR